MCGPEASRWRTGILAVALLLLLFAGCSPKPRPELVVRPDAVTLALTQASTFRVMNAGQPGSTLRFTLQSTAPWLLLEPREGRVEAGRSVTVTVRVRSGAEPQDEAEVLVTTNAGDARVRVSLGSFTGATICAGNAFASHVDRDPLVGSSELALQVEAFDQPGSGGPPRSTSEVLILYHPQAVTPSSAVGRVALSSDLAARSGARLVRAGIGSQHDLMRLPAHAADSVRAALERDPRVAAVVPNLPVHRLGAPSDPFYAEQWWAWCFGLEEAWAVTTGEVTRGTDPTVVIAVIDDGFNVAHRDLADKLLPGFDFAEWNDDVRGASPHGTHVAGIALAAGNNGAAIAGVAHGANVRLLPVKVFPDDVRRTGTTDALLNGMRWAVGLPVANVEPTPHPAQVVNLSLGVGSDETRDTLFKPTVAQMRAHGAVVVAAAGNGGSGGGVEYPARTEGVIAVGSVDWTGVRSRFSTHGPGLDLMAPGGAALPGSSSCANVLSLGPSGATSIACLAGTSMAAPFVSGTAALLMAQEPERYRALPAAVEARLFGTALKTHGMSTDEYGAGIVCADAALGAPSRCGWAP